MEVSELLKKVRKIEIKMKGLTKHIFSGEYHSAFKGRGMSFSEVRNYAYGDDVRNIDWNVTARYNEPFVKIFEEERELTVMVMIDVSPSAYFGTVNQMKNEMITEVCAILAFSANMNNDKVGVIFFSDRIEKYIPPKKGKSHVLRIIRELIDFQPTGKGTDFAEALRFFNNIVKKRSIAFVLSDFFTAEYKDALRIASKRHDITGIHVHDPREYDLPSVGLIRALDPETGEQLWIDTSSKAAKKKYREWFEQNLADFKKTFFRSGADVISIQTDESYVNALLKFFKRRHKT
ncbi:MAG: DUF58 domain-containing protein [Bacteroidota bacterium]